MTVTLDFVRNQVAETLRSCGIANPPRLVRLIQESIAFLELDLSGLTILTEAASGPFVVTPVIAVLAGADRVLALTRDSQYASASIVIEQTRALESLCGKTEKVEIHTERSLELFSQSDIVTNLGFVRPIDARAVAAMKQTAVVPLMCEAWEFRPGDVDLKACQNKGIAVLGTNEDYPGLEVFAYCSWLCLKMLFDAQIEVHKSNIVVVSSDKFGKVVERVLRNYGVNVILVQNLRDNFDKIKLANVDALIIADYTRDDIIIGNDGDLEIFDLAHLAPTMTIVQLAGRIEVQNLIQHGISVYPGKNLEARRMAMTLAELGPRPIVELHTAGLKVGELSVRGKLDGRFKDLAQKLN